MQCCGLLVTFQTDFSAIKFENHKVEQVGANGQQTYVHVMDAVWSDKGHQLLVNALQEIAADRDRW